MILAIWQIPCQNPKINETRRPVIRVAADARLSSTPIVDAARTRCILAQRSHFARRGLPLPMPEKALAIYRR